jgi:hypothetical protein
MLAWFGRPGQIAEAPQDLDHRQPATLGVQRVPMPGELLLLREELLTGDEPLALCHDLRIIHPILLSWIS